MKTYVLENTEQFSEVCIEKVIDTKLSEYEHLSLTEKVNLKTDVINAIYHYDILQPLLDDATISEIMINGPYNIFVEQNGTLTKSKLVFESREHLMLLVDKIALEIDRPINLSSPILDARLKDGSRVNIVLDPIAKDGPVVTIRKFGEQLIDMSALIESDMLSQEVADFLSNLILAKYNLFICGGTGTGKTTLLNCLSSCIPLNERLITIEDARELNLKHHQNLIALESKENTQSDIKINIASLIKTALRMRPNRIIVGEVRGSEVNDMLQAMNTGHDGSMSTGHGNSPIDMLMRLESIASQHGSLSGDLIRKQVISAIDIIIHIERTWQGKRYISQIAEVDKKADHYTLITHYDYYDGDMPSLHALVNQRKLLKYEKNRL
jgi:pilus assembly protein CpaF